jgi:hypothetical protein
VTGGNYWLCTYPVCFEYTVATFLGGRLLPSEGVAKTHAAQFTTATFDHHFISYSDRKIEIPGSADC